LYEPRRQRHCESNRDEHERDEKHEEDSAHLSIVTRAPEDRPVGPLLRGGNAVKNAQPMSELIERITELIESPERDAELLEQTLTDGYARALSLEAEQQRLERRLAEARAELLELRGRLIELRQSVR
jgi:hypothetical protein